MDELIAKAKTLLEALPYMQRFKGKVVVIKYGGSAMLDDALKLGFAEDVVLLNSLGLKPVVVHGGGPQIGKALKNAGIESRFVRGLRVTDEPTMEIVEMVLAGRINKDIVANMCHHGGRAVGLSGKDGSLIRATKQPAEVMGDDGKTEHVDLGWVGRVEEVRPDIVERLLAEGIIPVIAPIGFGSGRESYNINADHAASKVAAALDAEKLILLTDVEGVLNQDGVLQPFVEVDAAKSQISAGGIQGGMVPKIECAMEALNGGVRQVHIIDGRVRHAVLLEIFTKKGVGTEVVFEARDNE